MVKPAALASLILMPCLAAALPTAPGYSYQLQARQGSPIDQPRWIHPPSNTGFDNDADAHHYSLALRKRQEGAAGYIGAIHVQQPTPSLRRRDKGAGATQARPAGQPASPDRQGRLVPTDPYDRKKYDDLRKVDPKIGELQGFELTEPTKKRKRPESPVEPSPGHLSVPPAHDLNVKVNGVPSEYGGVRPMNVGKPQRDEVDPKTGKKDRFAKYLPTTNGGDPGKLSPDTAKFSNNSPYVSQEPQPKKVANTPAPVAPQPAVPVLGMPTPGRRKKTKATGGLSVARLARLAR